MVGLMATFLSHLAISEFLVSA